jgi:hypothetical protein
LIRINAFKLAPPVFSGYSSFSIFSNSDNIIKEGSMPHPIPHKIPAATKAWIKKEIKHMRDLHKKIAKQMNEDLAPQRAKWYEEFFERIQRPGRGFNVHFETRRVIPEEEIPKKPRRKDKVVW